MSLNPKPHERETQFASQRSSGNLLRPVRTVDHVVEDLSDHRRLHTVSLRLSNHFRSRTYLLPLITYRILKLLTSNTLICSRLLLRSQLRSRSRHIILSSTCPAVRRLDVLNGRCLSREHTSSLPWSPVVWSSADMILDFHVCVIWYVNDVDFILETCTSYIEESTYTNYTTEKTPPHSTA
jgi:hypothetical protein